MGTIAQYDLQGNLLNTILSSGRNVYRHISHIGGDFFLVQATNATALATYVVLYQASGKVWNAVKILVTLPSSYSPQGICWVDNCFYTLFSLSSLPPKVYLSRHTPDGAFMFTLDTGNFQLVGLSFDGNQLYTIDGSTNPDKLNKIDIKNGSNITLIDTGVSCPADGLSEIFFHDGCLCVSGGATLYQFYPDGGIGKTLSLTSKGICIVGDFIYVCN